MKELLVQGKSSLKLNICALNITIVRLMQMNYVTLPYEGVKLVLKGTGNIEV